MAYVRDTREESGTSAIYDSDMMEGHYDPPGVVFEYDDGFVARCNKDVAQALADEYEHYEYISEDEYSAGDDESDEDDADDEEPEDAVEESDEVATAVDGTLGEDEVVVEPETPEETSESDKAEDSDEEPGEEYAGE